MHATNFFKPRFNLNLFQIIWHTLPVCLQTPSNSVLSPVKIKKAVVLISFLGCNLVNLLIECFYFTNLVEVQF